jgi:GTP-binding protein EngB required for normal cell division
MPVTGQPDTMSALLLLETLSEGQDRHSLTELRGRLKSRRLRVLVTGEAKRGKSTLINALLGREILPMGVTPVTAAAITITQGHDEEVEVRFASGDAQRMTLDALPDFGTEQGNPGNNRQVAAITVRADTPILGRGFEIVDTPGTGSVFAHNTDAADVALPTMDAAIFVLSADPPVSAAERDLLKRVAGLSMTTFVVLNKIDYLRPEELDQALAFTRRVTEQAMGRPVSVYALSARNALTQGADPGFAAFMADFEAYLDSGRENDIEAAARRRLHHLAQLMLDDVALSQRVISMPAEQAAAQVAAFGAKLAEVRKHGIGAADRATAESKRLLASVNLAASDTGPQLTKDVSERLGEILRTKLADARPAEIERLGRPRLAGLIRECLDSWRQQQARSLESSLDTLARQLSGELRAELTTVRNAAADLLGVELTVPAERLRLDPGIGFFYDFGEYVDQAELIAGTIRRHLPGPAGQRRARQHLTAQVPDLTDRQLGRVRADLQYRLAEATRRLITEISRGHGASAERLAAALERAALIRGDSADQAARQQAGLAQREQRLRQALSLLG